MYRMPDRPHNNHNSAANVNHVKRHVNHLSQTLNICSPCHTSLPAICEPCEAFLRARARKKFFSRVCALAQTLRLKNYPVRVYQSLTCLTSLTSLTAQGLDVLTIASNHSQKPVNGSQMAIQSIHSSIYAGV